MATKRSSRSTFTKAENLHFRPPTRPPTSGEEDSDDPFDLTLMLKPAIKAAARIDHRRGTKRSATVAAQTDEPNEDKGEGEDSGSKLRSRKAVTPAGRRVRFQFLPVSHPKRRRVSDGLEAVQTAPDDIWVAVGEDRCKPCRMVGREICKPQWSAGESCKSCVFCADKSWSCTPPDSWLEKVASILHPKQAPAETHEAATDDVSIEAEKCLLGLGSDEDDTSPATAPSMHPSSTALVRQPLVVGVQHARIIRRFQKIKNVLVNLREVVGEARRVNQEQHDRLYKIDLFMESMINNFLDPDTM